MEEIMTDLKFGDPPRNGKSVRIMPGNAPPYRVEVWVNGTLATTKTFATVAEAEKFQREEVVR
jgi:hypothetical protein